MGSLDLLAGLTARLASTERLDEIVDTVVHEIVALGFGAVWMAVLDEHTSMLSTVKEMVDGVDTTDEMPRISSHDLRMPIGQGFRDRKMVNIRDPDALHILERADDAVPPGQLALPRVIYNHLRGRPFACGPLFGSRGQPVGALGLSSYRGKQPIPDELLGQGMLRAFTQHLGLAMERARRVEQLNASLARAQAAIQSDARVKAVGEIASAVAHDLNHLTGLALLASQVGMRSPGDAMDMLPRIERANRAIGDLARRLQRLARDSAAEREAANLPQIVDDLLIMIRPMLRARSIEVDVDLPTAVSEVRCDRVLVQQVVLNLLVNAHDALAEVPSARRRIRIQIREGEGAVRLTVADSGPGIAPEVIPKLFQQLVTTKRDGHLGLGLAAAHASLQPYGGKLEARNAPDGGAVFEITLAVAPPCLADCPELAAQDWARSGAAEPRPRARILAIDDDPDVVYIIRAYLEPLGHTVATATGSADALATAGAQPFDLVLCDIAMPKQNGIDVCRSLRDDGYRGKLVLMTGWENYQLSDEQRTVECDTLLKKPFLGADLIRVIDALIGS